MFLEAGAERGLRLFGFWRRFGDFLGGPLKRLCGAPGVPRAARLIDAAAVTDDLGGKPPTGMK